MFELYKQTEMEKKIEKLYRERSILTPMDLDIHKIAKAFDIHLDYSEDGPQRAIWDDETTVIFLKPTLPEEKQREVFYHEFAHPLMHHGDQTSMRNKPFQELQEFQANQFQINAAIPFFMLNQLEIPKNEYQVILFIAKVFRVSLKLARKRFEQIKRRIIQRQLDEGSIVFESYEDENEYEATFPLVEDLFSPCEIKQFNLSTENKNKVYYDTYNGELIPLWYTIEIERGQINWSKEFIQFPIDFTYDFSPVSDFKHLDTDAFIPLTNLSLNPSSPNYFAVKTSCMKETLMYFDIDPYNIRRFVLNIKDLEEFLQLTIVGDNMKSLVQIPITNN